jgi:hypothetical protein
MIYWHEARLMHDVGLKGRERRRLLAAAALPAAEVGARDLLAGGASAHRRLADDLPHLFERLLSPFALPVDGVIVSGRRYRRAVILAAALHQAGITAQRYRSGLSAGHHTIDDFKRPHTAC